MRQHEVRRTGSGSKLKSQDPPAGPGSARSDHQSLHSSGGISAASASHSTAASSPSGGMHRTRIKIASLQAVIAASSLAASSQMRKGAKVASTIGESGGYSRSFLEFRRIRSKAELDLIDSQLDLVEELGLMSPDDAINTVFGLLDKDNRGRFDTRELANGFREAGGDARVTRLLRKAADALPSGGDGTMNRTDLHDYIRFITPKFECTTHEVIELLVVKVLFDNSSRGRGIFRHMPTTRADAAAGEKPNERMLALFDLFDKKLAGQVDFKEVAVCVYNATETDQMDEFTKNAWSALLSQAEEKKKTISYGEFIRLVDNVVTAAKMDFNDVADSMTLAMCQPSYRKVKEKMSSLFSLGADMKKTLHQLDQEIRQGDAPDTMDIIQYRKMERLFILWDTDNDMSISVAELALGMRKFHEQKDIDETVEDSISSMITFDANLDGRLNKPEFAHFIEQLAIASDVEMNELLDFMVVTSVSKKNSIEEVRYVEYIGKKVQKQLKRGQRGRRRTRSMGT